MCHTNAIPIAYQTYALITEAIQSISKDMIHIFELYNEVKLCHFFLFLYQGFLLFSFVFPLEVLQC